MRKTGWSMGCMLLLLLVSCGTGRQQAALKEHVFVVNIVPDSVKLKAYLDYHAHIWPEVEAGFKKAGYHNITLYRYDHLLVMTVTVPEGADLAQMGKIAESYDPRCAEWNRLMDTYQQGIPGTAPQQKWVEVKPFYTFDHP
ncbi:L-rhamnose mutarotase [Chitinophaga qingshengii]|uniref:L-rhamnose mutarotase n=1 Tax=Chitinophaga qingshengii TaxID=1569794 RepID=A0ABR7TJC5_9BACT|nr:L-rhamnose mutarotase [Chitinophaga qingshengii]MBC9930591.1 L-rhamnose mutarotase [Chitinophaga qingshengii]